MDSNDRTPDRILYAFKARGPQTASDLGRELGITPVAVRQHLDRLSQDGLLVFEDRRETVGRPKRYWSLSGKGHDRFPDRHADLTLDMIGAVRELYGDEGLERVVSRRERNMFDSYESKISSGRSLGDKLRLLAKCRSAEGYMAEVTRAGTGDYVFTENHCPICAAAKVCQGFCRSELEIFSRLFEGEAHWERTEHIVAGARRCAYRVSKADG